MENTEQQKPNRTGNRKRRFDLVAMRLDRSQWKEYIRLARASGGNANASIRAHIAETLGKHEQEKAAVVIADELESLIGGGGENE